MIPRRPVKTATDYLVTGLSPALIMLLVGSLCFFLVQVFYRGEAVGSVRWVLFWFVLASVLVARIGIEQGPTYAAGYGIALALATWMYLARIHPAYFLGAMMLGIVWWCAHKLTWDCTLIDDDDDASGRGLMQSAKEWKPAEAAGKSKTPGRKERHPGNTKVVHPPGVWLVYFSVAALPVFGIGQTLLPSDDAAARRNGFLLLFLYLVAALGLLLTTSFLGLRRYLRQRFLKMPGDMAFAWVRFGAGFAAVILVVALLLPRPGVTQAWGTLGYHIDYRLRQASRWALRFNPPGQGPGRPGEQAQQPSGQQGQGGDGSSPNAKPESGAGESAKSGAPDQAARTQGAPFGEKPGAPQPVPGGQQTADQMFHLLRALLWLAVAAAAGWWLWRRRELLLQMARSAWAALAKFFRDLLSFGPKTAGRGGAKVETSAGRRPFASFENPFVTGRDRIWPPERLILYTYEAMQSWASARGVEFSPQQTAREFCGEVRRNIPEVATEMNNLAFLYGHAAYGKSVPAGFDAELLRQLWRYLDEAAGTR